MRFLDLCDDIENVSRFRLRNMIRIRHNARICKTLVFFFLSFRISVMFSLFPLLWHNGGTKPKQTFWHAHASQKNWPIRHSEKPERNPRMFSLTSIFVIKHLLQSTLTHLWNLLKWCVYNKDTGQAYIRLISQTEEVVIWLRTNNAHLFYSSVQCIQCYKYTYCWYLWDESADVRRPFHIGSSEKRL